MVRFVHNKTYKSPPPTYALTILHLCHCCFTCSSLPLKTWVSSSWPLSWATREERESRVSVPGVVRSLSSAEGENVGGRGRDEGEKLRQTINASVVTMINKKNGQKRRDEEVETYRHYLDGYSSVSAPILHRAVLVDHTLPYPHSSSLSPSPPSCSPVAPYLQQIHQTPRTAQTHALHRLPEAGWRRNISTAKPETLRGDRAVRERF